jgi:hypothetical protein
MIKLPDSPPERRGELKSSRERIRSAIELFETNFDLDGNPTTLKGIRLFLFYGWFDPYHSRMGRILFGTAKVFIRADLFWNNLKRRLSVFSKSNRK